MRKVKQLVNRRRPKNRVSSGAGDGIRTHDILLREVGHLVLSLLALRL